MIPFYAPPPYSSDRDNPMATPQSRVTFSVIAIRIHCLNYSDGLFFFKKKIVMRPPAPGVEVCGRSFLRPVEFVAHMARHLRHAPLPRRRAAGKTIAMGLCLTRKQSDGCGGVPDRETGKIVVYI